MAARWPLSWRPTSCPHSTAARDHYDTSAVSLLRFTFLHASSCCAALAQPSPVIMARVEHARRRMARLMLDRSICIRRESYLRSGLFATRVHSTVRRVRVRRQRKLDWGDLWVRWVSSSQYSQRIAQSSPWRTAAVRPNGSDLPSAKARPLTSACLLESSPSAGRAGDGARVGHVLRRVAG